MTAEGDPRLPRGFWVAWMFLVASIAVEFSVVFWASTLVERRTAVTLTEASLLGALFLAGMFTGRLGLAFGLGTGHDVRRPATIGLGLALAGTGLAWISTIPLLSGAALFLAGLGVANLYPLGVAAALANAPSRLAQAGARLTLATGVAIVTAPFVLGVVADLAGVVVGWGVVIGLVLVAMGFASLLPRGAPEASTPA
jgi:MFS family permease